MMNDIFEQEYGELLTVLIDVGQIISGQRKTIFSSTHVLFIFLVHKNKLKFWDIL